MCFSNSMSIAENVVHIFNVLFSEPYLTPNIFRSLSSTSAQQFPILKYVCMTFKSKDDNKHGKCVEM